MFLAFIKWHYFFFMNVYFSWSGLKKQILQYYSIVYNQQISKVAFSLIITWQPIYKIKFSFFRILNSVSLELFSSASKALNTTKIKLIYFWAADDAIQALNTIFFY